MVLTLQLTKRNSPIGQSQIMLISFLARSRGANSETLLGVYLEVYLLYFQDVYLEVFPTWLNGVYFKVSVHS